MQSTSTHEDSELAVPDLLSSTNVIDSLEQHSDVVSWINSILEPSENDPSGNHEPTGLQELDKRVTHLVGVLDVASEETSSQVERLIDDISRGASRLAYDLHFMRDNALSLQELLRGVESRTKSPNAANTSAALEQLHMLDTAKQNMLAAREVLREAESWSTLESDVTSLLGEHNYEKASQRLSEANKSMVVFQNTPEYETRRTLMTSLQNQLEAALSSALVAAVNSQDVDVCRNYFTIFYNIQRESEFRTYYYGSRRASLMDAWQNAPLNDCESPSGASSVSFSQFLPTFYSSFVTVLQTERTSIPAIFPDPQPTLATLITSTLSALQPTFAQRLASVAAHHGPGALQELIKAYKATEEYAQSAEKILEKISYSSVLSPGPGDGVSMQRSHSRRRSRMSISGRMSLPPPTSNATGLGSGALATLDWDQDLFEPFLDFQVDYRSLEKRFLENALREITESEVRPSIDKSRLLRERSVDVFSVAEDAITRCLAFTKGYGFADLVKCLDAFFAKFANTSETDIGSRRAPTATASSASTAGDLSDLDYTPDDWSEIQSVLHLLEAVRSLRERLNHFESKLRSHLIQVSSQLHAVRQNPVGFDVSGTTRGAYQLLQQSSLNSAELQAMLDTADPFRAGDSGHPTPASTPDIRRTPSHQGLVAPTPLLTEAHEAISRFTKACQVALQDTILRPLRKRLATYPSLPLWSTPSDGKGKRAATGSNALSEVNIPTFSLSPSETMQRLAEGLLNLPRLFEVYADDHALSFSLETLPFIQPDLLRSLAEPQQQATLPAPGTVHSHSRRSPSLSLKTPPVAPPVHELELSPEAVSAVWLSSLALTLLAQLTEETLPGIRTLSSPGAAQLASDLGYLSSIVTALNVESEELELWKKYAEMDDTTGSQKVKENGNSDRVLATIARLRGWV
ncbi:hypothetical protein K474DRAFT_1661526 [Panus rudis PR-1116 ss-1]|nr:hypothetical protein K474DRAFT_1661526 [Panus rudis PR-1116 ss-1]